MRIVIAAVVALIIGIAAGWGTASLRLNSARWSGDPGGKNLPPPPKSTPAKAHTPRAVVDELEHDFGLQDAKEEGEHEFVIRNEGKGVLTLVKGKTTCKCTVSKLGKTRVKPGESAKVTLTWHGEGYVGKFRQSAAFKTNDPSMAEIEFIVSGEITTMVQAVPRKLVFSNISAGESSTAEIAVYCNVDESRLEEPFRIVSFKVTDGSKPAEKGIAKYFKVSIEPLPEGMLELEPMAKSGQLVKVTVEPGLPQGQFEQTISIATSLGADGSLNIPIKGKVTGDISVFGPAEYNSEKNVLLWGTVDAQSGAKCRLSLYVRGPHREEVQFKIARVFPKLLNVELGKKKQLGESALFEVPLTIEIPKGCRPVNYLGSGSKFGEILLDTNHPDLPQLLIRVSFIVKG